jgi:hypothetical protein
MTPAPAAKCSNPSPSRNPGVAANQSPLAPALSLLSLVSSASPSLCCSASPSLCRSPATRLHHCPRRPSPPLAPVRPRHRRRRLHRSVTSTPTRADARMGSRGGHPHEQAHGWGAGEPTHTSRRRIRRFAAGSPRSTRRPWRRGARGAHWIGCWHRRGGSARVNAPLSSSVSRQRGSSRWGDRWRRSGSSRCGDRSRPPPADSPAPPRSFPCLSSTACAPPHGSPAHGSARPPPSPTSFFPGLRLHTGAQLPLGDARGEALTAASLSPLRVEIVCICVFFADGHRATA